MVFMNRMLALTLFSLFLILSGLAQAQLTGISSYCTDLYTNKLNIVTNSFSGTGGNSFGVSAVTISLLIVFTVIVVLSIVYAVGSGFGIPRLVNFAKVEFVESFFNLLLIIVLIGGLPALAGLSSFFTNLASFGASNLQGAGAASVSPGTGMQGIYTNICTNLVNNMVYPTAVKFFWTAISTWVYQFLIGITLSVNLNKLFLPNFSIAPFTGFAVYSQIVLFELGPLVVILFIGLVIIFLLYVIYFLFPIFLYLGLVFRSFPWSRAAGGSLLSLFLTFYIIFPALYYPLSNMGTLIITATQQGSNCGSGLQGTTGTACPSIDSSQFISSTVSSGYDWVWSYLSGSGNYMVYVVDSYISIIAYGVVNVVMLGLVLLISFDILEAFGDFLGSPSLTSGKVLERLI